MLMKLLLSKRAILVMPMVLIQEVSAVEDYTFESLTPGVSIDGQDQWVVQPGAGQAIVVLGSDLNRTLVLQPYSTGPSVLPAFITRTNGSEFDFVPFTGAETNAIIQFEATGEYVAMFALGRDLNGDGMLTASEGELGPAFGVFDRKLQIREANLGTAYEDNFNEGGGDGNSGNDWYRIQLRVNFTANHGDGAASLYFMNLTDRHTFYESVPGLRNRPLGLLRLHADARPARWNAVWLQLQANGNSFPSVDNLFPNLNGIVITRIVSAGANVILQWRGGTGPYQVQQQSCSQLESWMNVSNPTFQQTATVGMQDKSCLFRVAQLR